MEIVKSELLCKQLRETRKFFERGEHSFDRIILYWAKGFEQKRDTKSVSLRELFSVTLELDELIKGGYARGLDLHRDSPARPEINVVAVYGDTVYFNVCQRIKKHFKETDEYTLWEINAGDTKSIVRRIDGHGDPKADIYFAVTAAKRPDYALTRESAARLKGFEVRGTPSFDGIGYLTGYAGLGGSNPSGFHSDGGKKLSLEEIKEKGLTISGDREYHMPAVKLLAVEDDIIYVRAGQEVTRFFAGEEFEFTGPSFTYDTAGQTLLYALRNGEPLDITQRRLREC